LRKRKLEDNVQNRIVDQRRLQSDDLERTGRVRKSCSSRATKSLYRLCAWMSVPSLVFMTQSYTKGMAYHQRRQNGFKDENSPTYAPSKASPTLVHPLIFTSLAKTALSPQLSPSQISLLKTLGGAIGEYDRFGRGSIGDSSCAPHRKLNTEIRKQLRKRHTKTRSSYNLDSSSTSIPLGIISSLLVVWANG
jgi:hypothetical protein